jgi:homocysteine S-methyltransferase
MAKDTRQLPHLDRKLFLTDGGIETTLIFHDGLELPHFAAFHLLRDAKGREALVRYYESYIAIAKAAGLGFVLESPTWRASRLGRQARLFAGCDRSRQSRCDCVDA